MFKNPQVLNSQEHGKLRFAPAADFAFAKELTSAPLVPVEITEAAVHYPVLFTQTGPVTALAILGLRDTNVFLDQKNRWTVPFVPAHVRRYPFLLAQVEGTDQFRLAADIEAPQFASKRKGDTIFTGEGQITEQLNGVVTLITEFEKNMRTGRAVMAELETTGVLVAKDLGFKDGKEQHVIGGFRIVDIEKVEKLDDATLARWVRNGVMSIIHAHLASLRNLSAVALASSRPDAVQ